MVICVGRDWFWKLKTTATPLMTMMMTKLLNTGITHILKLTIWTTRVFSVMFSLLCFLCYVISVMFSLLCYLCYVISVMFSLLCYLCYVFSVMFSLLCFLCYVLFIFNYLFIACWSRWNIADFAITGVNDLSVVNTFTHYSFCKWLMMLKAYWYTEDLVV